MKPYYAILKMVGEGTPMPEVLTNKRLTQSIWEKNNAAAEKYNDPGRFTAFIGYEWSSNTGGNNLHRVVMYRDASDKANQMIPFSSFISENPEDLWKWMAQYEEKTGGQLLAIPHNGNMSNGTMYRDTQFDGSPITREWAETRANYEPLIEATQMKGDGEAHPFLSPNDEFADYETWDQGNLNLSVPKTNEMLRYEYARSALKRGLEIEQQTGVNPYQFGMISSTDAHTGMAAARRGQLLQQAAACRTLQGPSPSRHAEVRRSTVQGHGYQCCRLCRGMGHREHSRSNLRRHASS